MKEKLLIAKTKLGAICEKIKNVDMVEDEVVAQILFIISGLISMGYDAKIVHHQLTHDVPYIMGGQQQEWGIFVAMLGVCGVCGFLESFLFKRMKKNIQERIKQNTNAGR